MNREGIFPKVKFKINDKHIKRHKVVTSNVQAVVAKTLIGKVILGEKLEIGDEEGTFTINGNLLTIQDRNEIERLKLGEYESNRFGLQLFNKTGRDVVLDENGILQTWQDGRSDNVDSANGLRMYIYLPSDTLSIRQARLNFRTLPFRAYSSATKAGGATTRTSSGGGATTSTTTSGGSVSKSTKSGGGSTKTSSSKGGVSKSTANGGGSTESSSAVANAFESYLPASISGTQIEDGDGSHYHISAGVGELNKHTHTVSIPSHSHNFSTPNHTHSVSIPSHSHNFTIPSHSHKVTISNHTHTVKIPSHKHDIDFGIYEDTFAKGVGVVINGIDRSSQLGGKFDSSQANLNIDDYLEVGKWNEIELTSNTLGRIDGSVFIQTFQGT